jgi:hypothetical protein
LLLIGLPLTVLLGAVAAFILFPQQGVGFALLLGAILAPTDAALQHAPERPPPTTVYSFFVTAQPPVLRSGRVWRGRLSCFGVVFHHGGLL